MRDYRVLARKVSSVVLSAAMLLAGVQYQPPPAIAQPAPPAKAEAVSKRTTNSRTFELSDGTYETEVFDEPIFYESEATSTLLPIDSSLEETFTVRGRAFRNRANSFTTELPGQLDSGWASVESTMGRVAFRPATRPTLPEAAVTLDTAPERNPMSEARLQYKGAFAGADLEYVSGPTGLKETIVLERFTGRSVYSFDLVAADVMPRMNENGGIDFVSEESTRPVFQIEAPYMYDSSGAEQGGPAVSRAVHYELLPALAGWRIDVVADREWLADSARVWPVRIDPTVKYAWMSPYVTDLAYVNSQYPTENFNPANWYEDGTFPLKVGTMGGYYYRSYLKSTQLDDTLETLRNLGSDVQILYARLALQCYWNSPSPSTITFDKVTSWWTAAGITWNAQPSYVYAGQFSQNANCSSDDLYITSLMQGWLDSPGTNYGLMLWGSSAFTKYIGWDFYTWSDGLQHPSYRIAWTTVPKVEPVAPMPDTVVDGQPTIVWNYDDDKHRLADLNGDLISKPQQKVEIQFSSKPDSSGLLDTVPVDDLKDYDHTVTTNEYGFANNTRYFWRMRAAGLSDWPNAGDVTWSSWTDWTGFTTGDAQAASDGRGVEAARASEPIGAGASVEASSGALVVARQDLAGPARGGSLSYGATYRSDQAGSAELPTGWRSPVSTLTRNDNRAPTPGFDSLSGWSTGGDTSNVSITSVTGGRTGNRLRFYTTTADCTAYVKSHPDGTGAYPVWPGQRVEAGAWMLASGLSLEADTGSPAVYGGVVKIHFWKADGTYVGEARSGNFAEYNSGSWQHVGTAATVPADAYFARVNIEYQNAKGTLYVDDAYFGDGAVDLADADGTTHHMRQVKDGTFTRDPLAQGAGLAYKNLAKGAPVSAGTLTSVNDAPDPGFDKSWATGGWYTNSTSVATQQTTVKRTGTGALKFYSASNTSVYVSPCSGTTATMFPIGGVRHLHSSMWLNTDSLAVDTTKSEYGVFFKYHFYDSAGNFISTVQPSSYSNTADTNGWREVFMDGAVPTNASFVKFNIEYRYASGTAYVDDVEMGYGALVNQRATDGLTTSSSLGYDAIPIDSGRYLQIDLGSVQAFSQLRLGLWDFQVSDCAYAAGPTYTYKVVAAANTADFGTSGEKQVVPESGTSVSGREWKDHSFAPVEARYIRIYPTAVSYGNEFRVTEVEVPRYELGHTPILLDSAGRIAATCDLSGNLIKQTFDTSSRLSTITDETGRSIGLTYVNGELSQLSWTGKDSAGTQVSESKRVSYSGAGSANTTLTVSADDSTAADGTHLRTVVSYHYDSAGRIDRITDADGVAICIAYVSGKVGSVTYADGSTKTFTYTHVAGEDSVTVTTAGGTEQLVSKTVYEAGTGRALSAVVDPNGLNLSSTVSYDCYGGVRSTDDPMDHTTTTVRDGHGNVVRTSDEQSRKTSAVYDDDLLAESRDVKGNLAQSEYDAARRLLCSASAISEAAADEDGGESAVTSVYDEFGNKTMGSIPGSTAENLLLDPCFANNVTGSGFGWDGAAASAISVLGTEAYQGAYYINLHADAAQSYYTSDQVAVSPERTYMVSAWVRGEGQVCIKEYDKDGAFIRTRTPVIFTGSTSGAMTRVSGVYWPDSNVAKVAVQLWADTGDTAEIDNVRFEMATRIGADNLLDNASFETTSGLQPVTWTPRGTGNATMKAVYDMAVSGAKSAYIKTTGAASTNDGYFYSGWTRVRPGERYTVSGSIKTKNIASTGAAHINVLYYSSYLGTQTNRLDIGSSTGTTDWTRKAANIVVPPSGTSFMRVSIETTGAAGEAWFDTIAIEPVRGIETYGYDNGTDTFQTRSDSITEHTSRTAYDARGRSTESRYSETSGGTGELVSTSEYDEKGRLASVTSFPDTAFDISASYTYSDAGRLESVTDPLGRQYALSYDASGQLDSVLDPLGIYSRTLYDGLGRTKATVWPSASLAETRTVSENHYDSVGRPVSTTYFDATGSAIETITTTYDADSKVTGTSMAGTGYSSSATYDNLDRVVASSATGPAEQVNGSAVYDKADLVTKTTWTALGVTRSTEITYAKTGELSKMIVQDGTAPTTTTTWYFAFDVANKLMRTASVLGTHLVSYDPAGRLSALKLGKGDGTSLTEWATQRLTYDGWERLASVVTDFATGTDATDTYQYDDAGRISAWGRTGFGSGDIDYTFDAAGNLTEKVVGSTTTTFAYNAGNQLTSEVIGSQETTHAYDEFGRLVRSGSASEVTTYIWDALGHLGAITNSGGLSATYEYGISGMRERKTVTSGSTTKSVQSVWSGMQLLAELDSDGTRYEYIYGGGAPLELIKTTSGGTVTRYAYQVDAGGSVIGITDASGNEIARYAYDAYGVLTAASGTDLATRNPLRYRGYYYDIETGFYYLPVRYYVPSTARFLGVDPAPPDTGDPSSLNRYSYCIADPVNAIDPTGAVMAEFYRADEQAALGGGDILAGRVVAADSRRHSRGYGGTQEWLKHKQDKVVDTAKWRVNLRTDSIFGVGVSNKQIEMADDVVFVASVVAGVALTVATGGAGAPVAAVLISGGFAVAGGMVAEEQRRRGMISTAERDLTITLGALDTVTAGAMHAAPGIGRAQHLARPTTKTVTASLGLANASVGFAGACIVSGSSREGW